MAWKDEAKVVGVSGFYLASNFIVLGIPLLGYLAWRGSWICRAIGAAVVVDYAVPLRIPQLWLNWCRWTDDSLAKAAYFRAHVVVEGEFKKDRNYLMCYHPHSLFCIGYNLATRALYDRFGIEPLFAAADIVKYLPLLRRVLTWWGFTPVSAEAMRETLRRPYPQNLLTLMPGGIGEMFYGIDEEQIILSKRKGFCKLALETGACLVPCYVMGANQVYTRYLGPRSFPARVSSAIRMSLLIWTDRFGIPFGIVPHKVRLLVLVGQPIEVRRVAEPSREQVDELHALYSESLRSLFDRHKASLGPGWASRQLYMEDEVLPSRAYSKARPRGAARRM